LDESLSYLDTKIAARFEDLKFSQCGVKNLFIEAKKSQNTIKGSIFKVKQAQITTLNQISATSNNLDKKISQIQSNQNKIKDFLNGNINQVKNKVNDIGKVQNSFKFAVGQLEIDVNQLRTGQNAFFGPKFDELKIKQSEVKNLIESKLNEFANLTNEMKISIIEELKLKNGINLENLAQNLDINSKIDDLQVSITLLSQGQNDTVSLLKNLTLDKATAIEPQNVTSETVEELKMTLNATLDEVKASIDALKTTQDDLVSSNDKIQQSLDDLTTKLSNSIRTTTMSTQDNEVITEEDKFAMLEEKLSIKFEKNIKEAEERLMTKFEAVLEDKLGMFLDKKLEKMMNGQVGEELGSGMNIVRLE
jgi:hypothetical protein